MGSRAGLRVAPGSRSAPQVGLGARGSPGGRRLWGSIAGGQLFGGGRVTAAPWAPRTRSFAPGGVTEGGRVRIKKKNKRPGAVQSQACGRGETESQREAGARCGGGGEGLAASRLGKRSRARGLTRAAFLTCSSSPLSPHSVNFFSPHNYCLYLRPPAHSHPPPQLFENCSSFLFPKLSLPFFFFLLDFVGFPLMFLACCLQENSAVEQTWSFCVLVFCFFVLLLIL